MTSYEFLKSYLERVLWIGSGARWWKNETLKNCNLLHNLLQLMKFGEIVQKDELHKILDYISSVVIPFNDTNELLQLSSCYVFLGGYDRGDCLKTAMLYDPKTNKWSALPSMLEHRGRLDIAVVDGKVYAVGGSSGNKELMTAEVYDSRTGAVKWQRVPSCRLPRASCGQFSCRYLS